MILRIERMLEKLVRVQVFFSAVVEFIVLFFQDALTRYGGSHVSFEELDECLALNL